MEQKHTLDALPQPEDERTRLLERQGRVLAVRRYSGGWSAAKFEKNRQALLDALERDSVVVPIDWPD
jgi:hypothetical protein